MDPRRYSAASFTSEVLDGFARHQLPLHVAVLDDGWHNMEHAPLCFPDVPMQGSPTPD